MQDIKEHAKNIQDEINSLPKNNDYIFESVKSSILVLCERVINDEQGKLQREKDSDFLLRRARLVKQNTSDIKVGQVLHEIYTGLANAIKNTPR